MSNDSPKPRAHRLALLAALALSACVTSGSPGPVDGTVAADAGWQWPTPPDAGPMDLSRPAWCDVPAPTACPAPSPSYADVAAVIAARCQSCHDGRGPQWPLDTYGHVVDWQDTIRSQLLDCTMPPPDAGSAITVAERLVVLNWIRCGAPK